MVPPQIKTSRRCIPTPPLMIALCLTIMSPFQSEARPGFRAVEDITLPSQSLTQAKLLGKQLESSTPLLPSSLALETQHSEQASMSDEDLVKLRLWPGSRSGSPETLTSVSKGPLTPGDWTDHHKLASNFQHPKTDTESIRTWGNELQLAPHQPGTEEQHTDLSGNFGSTSLGSASRTSDEVKAPSDPASVIHHATPSSKDEDLLGLSKDKVNSQSDLQQTQDTASESLKAGKRPVVGFPLMAESDYVDAQAKNFQRGHARPRILKRPVDESGPSTSAYQAGSSGSTYHAQQLQSNKVVNPIGATPKSTLSSPKGAANVWSNQNERYRALVSEYFSGQPLKTAQLPVSGDGTVRPSVEMADLDGISTSPRRYRDLLSEHANPQFAKISSADLALIPAPELAKMRSPVEISDLNSGGTPSSHVQMHHLKSSATPPSHVQRESVRPINSGGFPSGGPHSWKSYLAASSKAHQEMHPDRYISNMPLLHQYEAAKGVPSRWNPEHRLISSYNHNQFSAGALSGQEHSAASKKPKLSMPILMADPNTVRTLAMNFQRGNVRPINLERYSSQSSLARPIDQATKIRAKHALFLYGNPPKSN